jgi:hypothetical protein
VIKLVNCVRCKKEKQEDGFKCCPSCREKQKEISRAKYAKKKEALDKQVKEFKFQRELRKKDELEVLRKKEVAQRKWDIDRFLIPSIHPFSSHTCSSFRRATLEHKHLLRSLQDHYSACPSCQDWKYEFDNHTLTDEDGNFYQGNKEEIDFPLGEDAETCRKFRDRYANPEHRNEFYALLEDTHLPTCEYCKAWKTHFDESHQDENWKEVDYSKMGENKAGWNDMTDQNDKDVLDALRPETPEERERRKSPFDEAIRQQQEFYRQEQPMPQPQEPQPAPQPKQKQESYTQQLLRQFQNARKDENQGQGSG